MNLPYKIIFLYFLGIGNKKNPLHFLVIHGSIAVKNPPIFKLDSVKDWFESSDSNGRVEGVVWHCPAGVLYKVSSFSTHNSFDFICCSGA